MALVSEGTAVFHLLGGECPNFSEGWLVWYSTPVRVAACCLPAKLGLVEAAVDLLELGGYMPWGYGTPPS